MPLNRMTLQKLKGLTPNRLFVVDGNSNIPSYGFVTTFPVKKNDLLGYSESSFFKITDYNDINKLYAFSMDNASIGNTVRIIKFEPKEILSGLSNLIPGKLYYINENFEFTYQNPEKVFIGLAISTDSILLRVTEQS